MLSQGCLGLRNWKAHMSTQSFPIFAAFTHVRRVGRRENAMTLTSTGCRSWPQNSPVRALQGWQVRANTREVYILVLLCQTRQSKIITFSLCFNCLPVSFKTYFGCNGGEARGYCVLHLEVSEAGKNRGR